MVLLCTKELIILPTNTNNNNNKVLKLKLGGTKEQDDHQINLSIGWWVRWCVGALERGGWEVAGRERERVGN